MGENLSLFSRFYYRPSRAASDALDNGSLAFAILVSAAVFVLWSFAGAPALLVHPSSEADHGARWVGLDRLMVAALLLLNPRSILALIAMFAGMTPVAIATLAVWEGAGSTSVVLRREYVSMLVCALLAWSAAYLPAGVLQIATGVPVISLAAHVFFLVLFVISLRTALGATTSHAAVATAAGWVTAIGIVLLGPFLGHFSYFLFSPWILYMLFRYYSPDVRSLGESMNSRRSFRRQLEASMVNPRDADAHLQLGLIYEQRRQFEDAEASFRRAVAIEPQDADSQLHLGRAVRAQGRPADALPHFEAALTLDPRVSRHEGWRDAGATLLDLGRAHDACIYLERYTNTREYDPEGLFYYGSALRALGRTAEARQAFEQSIAAVQTAPKYLRRQLRRWASEAKSALKALNC